MYLNKLYSEPEGLFETTEFTRGLNFIYGKKELYNPKKSLNSIGKSTFLDLIDFCLLGSFRKNHNPRLYAAKHLLEGFQIVLEFSIQEKNFLIKRSVDDPNHIFFGTHNSMNLYKIEDLKKIVGNLVFMRDKYEGKFKAEWFRNLINFYIKIQKFKQAKFLDPIKYIPELTELELNVYHFYLLDLDNSIPFKLYEHRVAEKGLSNSLIEIKRFVEEKYGLMNIKETQSEINRLRIEIEKLQTALSKFELGEQYEDAEKEANKLTESIKNNIYQNYGDREKIKSYEESFKIPENINMRRISTMYNQISKDLSFEIKKTLAEAISFRKELSKSRKEFLGSEIQKLQEAIRVRENNISSLEARRGKLFYFLSTKEAIKDLTEAFLILSEKRTRLSELEGNTKILFELTKELTEIESEINTLKSKVLDLLNFAGNEIIKFYENFNNIYDAVYIHSKAESEFSITQNFRKKSLIEIDITLPDMFGKGKNRGRTLVYDLSILMLNITNTPNFPRFLIHDGIFDGVDKSHFVSICEYIDNLVKYTDINIQYIATINEEGTLSPEKFGDKDHVAPEYIEENAIITLSPDHKLFKTNF